MISKIIKQTQDANILFLIQNASLRQSELNKDGIIAWKKRVEEAFKDPKQNVNIEVSAYASGWRSFAQRKTLLLKGRKNTTSYLEKELKKKY